MEKKKKIRSRRPVGPRYYVIDINGQNYHFTYKGKPVDNTTLIYMALIVYEQAFEAFLEEVEDRDYITMGDKDKFMACLHKAAEPTDIRFINVTRLF